MPESAPKTQTETLRSEQTAQTLASALSEQIRAVRLEIDLSNWESQVGAVASWLEPRVAGKRLVYLGESDHWIQEKYPYRLLFLQALLQLGWNRIGLEMGRADGGKIQRYLDSGEPGCFDRVGLYGADFSQPAVVTSGLFAESRELAGTGFRTYETRFFARLHGLIQSVPQSVSFFGFDLDVVPGGAYEDVRARFGKEATAWLEGLAELTRIESLAPDAALAALESLLKSLQSHRQMLIDRLGETRFSAVLQDLQTLRDSLAFTLVAYQNVSLDALFEAYAQREATMYRLVEEVLSEPGTRCILMGHNMHLLKRHQAASFGRPPESVNVWDVIGSRLYRRYPDQVMAIWQLCHEGEHSAPLAALPARIEPRSDTVEALLAQLGEQFLAEIKPEMVWLDQPRYLTCQNGQDVTGHLPELVDAVCFLRQVNDLSQPPTF